MFGKLHKMCPDIEVPFVTTETNVPFFSLEIFKGKTDLLLLLCYVLLESETWYHPKSVCWKPIYNIILGVNH